MQHTTREDIERERERKQEDDMLAGYYLPITSSRIYPSNWMRGETIKGEKHTPRGKSDSVVLNRSEHLAMSCLQGDDSRSEPPTTQ